MEVLVYMYIEKAKDTQFWEKVRSCSDYAPFVKELLNIWEKDCTHDIPASKYSEYIIFDLTGSRTEYEQSYFTRRRAMNASALLSLIFPEEQKYHTKLCDVIWAILDEYNWVLPAHIGTFKENRVAYIDLFAAETGFALSEIDYILGDRLPPLIRSRIRAEVDRRIIDAYTEDRKYWWEKCTNNWAAVCACSVGIAFLYLHPRERSTMLLKDSKNHCEHRKRGLRISAYANLQTIPFLVSFQNQLLSYAFFEV